MPRYFARPRAATAFWAGDDVYVEAMINSVTVSDHEATDTGILDATGDPIWRAPNPMGFGRDDEW